MPSATTNSVLQRVLKPGKLDATRGAGFRIVGNLKKGTIKHVGGLQVDGSADIPDDSTLKLRDFRIQGGGGHRDRQGRRLRKAPLFTFDPADAADLEVTLYFTETASLAIVGTDGIAGVEAGVATIDLKWPPSDPPAPCGPSGFMSDGPLMIRLGRATSAPHAGVPA